MSNRAPKHLWARLRAAFRVGRQAYHRFERDDGNAMAGYIAYSVFLSIFPFAIFMSTLSGILIPAEQNQAVIDNLFALAPDHIAQTIEPVLIEVIGQARGGLLTFSAIFAIWIATNAVEAIRIAFDRAYQAKAKRGFVTRRAVAVGFVFLAALTFAALGFIIILAPLGLSLAESFLGFKAPFGVGLLRYGFGLSVFVVFLLLLNRWLPSRAPGWRRVLPGILVSTVLWLIGAGLFSIYLSYAPSYTITYGAFAGVIVTLLFFYLTGAVVIFGAEVNAALLALRHEEAD